MKLTKLFGVAALATVATFALAACGSSKSSKSSDKDGVTTVKVGVMNLSDTEEARWKEVQKNLDDAKANIKLEFTQFTDYSQPNQAVRDGDVDINAFQHYNYLENWNKENSADLVSVADTYIAPIRLYSGTKDGKNKYTDVKDIPEKGTIAVPNDGSNESRAIKLLADNGLITLAETEDLYNLTSIAENPHNFEITELDAANLPRSLDDVDAAVINGNYALEANLNPEKDALAAELADSDESYKYINYLVVKEGNEESTKTKALIAALQNDDVKKYIEEKYSGSVIPAF